MVGKGKDWHFVPFILCAFFMASLLSSTEARTKYSETISVLKAAYSGEINAYHNYLAYAEKANSENYPQIANLFVALANSESIHARNFKRALSGLGVQINGKPQVEIKVSSTKKNLKRAITKELEEIDGIYPRLIRKIRPENHEASLRYLTYAWESEKQHRDLIKRIQSGTGMLFGLLAKKIESSPAQYFVCRICGSTLTALPGHFCPICIHAVSHYRKLESIY